VDLQENQRSNNYPKKRVYNKTLIPEQTYLKKIYTVQKCDANPNHRNIYWDLTFEEWSNLIQQNCHICGSIPTLKEGKVHMIAGTRVPINGIDRIENSKGYTITNVRPCCSTCNYMKHKLDDEKFLKHIEKIWRYNFANL
jgi:hypothetical protein